MARPQPAVAWKTDFIPAFEIIGPYESYKEEDKK
jgi:hypothetical protein